MNSVRVWSLGCVLMACGARSELSLTDRTTTDAQADIGAPVDAVVSCDPRSPFGAAVPVTELNTDSIEESMRLSPDELVAYFDSNRVTNDGEYDVYVATRSKRNEPFGPPQRIDGLRNPNGGASAPSVSGDGLQLYFFGDCLIDSFYGRLCEATRESTSDPFGNVTAVTKKRPGEPYVDPSGLRAYWDTVMATRPSDGVDFDAPMPITIDALTDAQVANVEAPVVNVDATSLYFAVYDPPHIFVAFSVGEREFADVMPLHSLDSPLGELPTWISPDGCRLYLTRILDSDEGWTSDLYVATRQP